MTAAGVTAAVIVVAGGVGTRLGRPEPKAFVRVSGRPVLERSLDAIFQLAEPMQVVIVAPRTRLETARAIVRATAGAAAGYVSILPGGATRQASVSIGLSGLQDGVDTVLVHDAARFLTPRSQFERVLGAVRASGAGVIPGLAVTDTIKRRDEHGLVAGTVDRSELVAVQTPQGFPRGQLERAYAAAGAEYTDDAALFSAAGHDVHLVEGDALAFKITTPWDLHRAEELIRADSGTGPGVRTGIGVDVHAFDEGEPLWLAGLYWPDEVGLSGHSDGDAVSHAICDALLSAAGLGDIGGRFGTSDPTLAGAHGDVFLRKTLDLVRGAGFEVANVAVQVIANRPKLAARRIEAEALLSRVVGAPVSVAATTSDGLGFTGAGRGLAAIATALLTVGGPFSRRK